jgi:deoxyadenosine/deoxycytidine kinase
MRVENPQTTHKTFIAIAGNIGTGKTSLAQMLSSRFGWAPHFEPVGDNPYLVDFYKNMTRWSFPLQIYFLTHRFKSHRMISEGTQSAVQDRSIYEDANIFARNLYEQGLMEPRDYRNYLSLYDCMCESLNPPDLVVYLRKSLPELKSGIAKRNREFESEMPDQYLVDLNRYYDEWIESYSLGKKLVVQCDSIDFVGRSDDFDYISKRILESLVQDDFLLNQSVNEKFLETSI